MNKEGYGERLFRKTIESDRIYADRLLIIDYRLLYSINQELKHIAFLGPLVDRAEELNGYRTIILIRSDDEREEAKKRVIELCFVAEVKTLEEIMDMKSYSTNSGIITTKLRYPLLRNLLVGNFYVLQ